MWDWDEPKRQANLAKHGVDFADVIDFDLSSAVVELDSRNDYGEVRETALGLIGPRVHHLTFTKRGGLIRVISLRKANTREQMRWVVSRKSGQT